MNYKDIMAKLDKLREGYKAIIDNASNAEQKEETKILYGEVEEVIHRFIGTENVVVQSHGTHSETFPNKIAAGLLATRSFYLHSGYQQLLMVIGKVRQQAEDPTIPQIEYSVSDLIRSIRRFRECCQYESEKPSNEREVQDILWIMLRSQYDRVDREDVLPIFGVKSYKPDFGIPDLRVLIEVKHIGPKSRTANIQEEMLADVPGYLNDTTKYDGMIVFVFDAAHKLTDPSRFIEDMRSVAGIIEVIVIPGF